MRKKQLWMKKGATVLAYGEKSIIVKMEENTIDGVDYVYYIYCRKEGAMHSSPYHPADVKEYSPIETRQS